MIAISAIISLRNLPLTANYGLWSIFFYTQPNKRRPFKISRGNIGMWIVGGFGLLASLSALFIGFVPPGQLKTGNLFFYESFLISGILILSLPPFILAKAGKR